MQGFLCSPVKQEFFSRRKDFKSTGVEEEDAPPSYDEIMQDETDSD